MKWSNTHLFTLREAPSDAEIVSHQLLVRAGYLKKLGPGSYTLQNLALRVLRKIERIIREELDRIGCTEILMPMVQPVEIWEETGREDIDVLQKFKNRSGQIFCLGPTHEEVVTDIVRKDVKSYRDLPKTLYQIQTKYRDEIRPRFGLMRGREFLMKDAYSFDASVEKAHLNYQKMREAYLAIFGRMGLDFRIVEADAGNIGGNMTHEFQVLAEAGEDKIVHCDSCEFAANIEVAPCASPKSGDMSEMRPQEEFATPGLRTIEELSKFLNSSPAHLVKTLFYMGPHEPIAILMRGSDEANPIKIKSFFKMTGTPMFLTEAEVIGVTSGARPGSCGPVGLKIPVWSDNYLRGSSNMVVGANKDDVHLRNVNFDRDFVNSGFGDFRMATEGELCVKCGVGKYRISRGIEVGHIFYLGTKYSESMRAKYLDSDGRSQFIEMGCYGIGVTRTLQASVEQNNDKDGIIWPVPITPYHVHICLLDPSDAACVDWVSGLASDLEAKGFEIFIDDRDERPGIKFKDADLLGFPVRVSVGKRGFQANEIEVVRRKGKVQKKVALNQVLSEISSILA